MNWKPIKGYQVEDRASYTHISWQKKQKIGAESLEFINKRQTQCSLPTHRFGYSNAVLMGWKLLKNLSKTQWIHKKVTNEHWYTYKKVTHILFVHVTQERHLSHNVVKQITVELCTLQPGCIHVFRLFGLCLKHSLVMSYLQAFFFLSRERILKEKYKY